MNSSSLLNNLILMCFVGFTMLPLSAELKVDVVDIAQTKITTNINQLKDQRTEGKSLTNITDNNPSTFYWTGSPSRKGQIIQFTFNHAIPLGKTLKIYSGFGIKNREDGDMIIDAVLESSTDGGKSWQEISTFQAGNVEAKITFQSRHYRILITKSQNQWGAIRHLTISDQPLTQKTIHGKVEAGGKTHLLSVTTDLDGFPGSEDPRLEKSFETMSKLYFEAWPKLVKWLDADPNKIPKNIVISFVSTLTHPAHVSGRTMTMHTGHLLNHPNDIEGCFIHELTHIVQAYPVSQPKWFIEGSADYTRYRYYPNRAWANSARARMNNEQPFGLYWNSACFLLWMEDIYKKPITAILSRAMVERKYSDTLFKDITGKTLEQLAIDYKKSQYRPKLNSPVRQTDQPKK